MYEHLPIHPLARGLVASSDEHQSRQEDERIQMPRPHDGEVSAVERRDLMRALPLCPSDGGGIDAPSGTSRCMPTSSAIRIPAFGSYPLSG